MFSVYNLHNVPKDVQDYINSFIDRNRIIKINNVHEKINSTIYKKAKVIQHFKDIADDNLEYAIFAIDEIKDYLPVNEDDFTMMLTLMEPMIDFINQNDPRRYGNIYRYLTGHTLPEENKSPKYKLPETRNITELSDDENVYYNPECFYNNTYFYDSDDYEDYSDENTE